MSDEKRPRRVKPMPEILPRGEGAWDVRHHPVGGFTNIPNRVMRVELDDNPQAENVRRHEMAHAMWSPDLPPNDPDLPMDILQSVEDMRMHHKLTYDAGLDLGQGFMGDQLMRKYQETLLYPDTGMREILLPLVSMAHTGDWSQLSDALSEAIINDQVDPERKELLNEASSLAFKTMQRMMSTRAAGGPTFDTTLNITRWLERMLGPYEAPKDYRKPKPGEEEGEEDKKKLEKMLEEAVSAIKEQSGTEIGWTDMEIKEDDLTERLPAYLFKNKRRAVDEGLVPRNLYRTYIDQKIFSTSKRVPGMSILFDCSGSMSWDRNVLMETIKIAPASTVATYASGSGNDGMLYIMARKGRRVSDELVKTGNKYLGHGNGCDGPALRWLGTQLKPRIWVSDGQVVGTVNGSQGMHPAHREEVAAICKTFGIVRVPHAKQAVELFKRIQRGMPVGQAMIGLDEI
jgi:hypothetical protein